ncbi:unnamed protein product [Pleuronectes platessa]|uniref:Uncharacterized protein n=1 Tax=Pleuronectes platessa TaxID=8262 RepID=A0A9N7ZDT2_PLEPL|nr:unnamed protein product [Pleuronectes platessa]
MAGWRRRGGESEVSRERTECRRRTWEGETDQYESGNKGQRYACMTPSMACAAGGGGGKIDQGRKGQPRQQRKQRQFYAWRDLSPPWMQETKLFPTSQIRATSLLSLQCVTSVLLTDTLTLI